MNENLFKKLPLISDESVLGEYYIDVDRSKKIKSYNTLIAKTLSKKTTQVNGCLTSLLMPMSTNKFFKDIWQQNYYFNSSNKYISGLSNYITIDKIIEGLTSKLFKVQDLRFVMNHNYSETYEYDQIDRNGESLKAFLNQKGSVVVDNIHQYVPALNEIWHEMVEIFRFPVTCTAYFTPAGTQTFPMHWDTDDVFVLQLEGVKEWSVHEVFIPDPLEHHIWGKYNYELGDQLFQNSLKENDLLYIPRGFMHQAIASKKKASLHITIGICIPTWHRIIQTAIEKIIIECGQIMHFRQPTDIMISDSNINTNQLYFDELKKIIFEKFSFLELKNSINELLARQEIRGIELTQILVPDLIFGQNTKFKKSNGIAFLKYSDNNTILKFGGYMHFFPMNYKSILEKIFICKESFTIDDLRKEFGQSTADEFFNYLIEEALIKHA